MQSIANARRDTSGILWVCPRIEEDRTRPLHPNSRQGVYRAGFSVGYVAGSACGAIVAGLLFLVVTQVSLLRRHLAHTSLASSVPNTPQASPSPSPDTEIGRGVGAVRPSVVGICGTGGARIVRGLCCIPALTHTAHPESFSPDPAYRGSGRWLCTGESGMRATRNTDGTTDVSRCLWCEARE